MDTCELCFCAVWGLVVDVNSCADPGLVGSYAGDLNT